VFQRYREIQKRGEERKASERGFTLIELLIVIVVLGILAAIVIFSLTGVTGQGKAAACTSDGRSIEIADDAYQAANGTFSPTTGALVGTGVGTSNSYLKTWPSDPSFTFDLGTNTDIATVTPTDTTIAAGAYNATCSKI
jgi:general secretion pathway protein G